MIRNILAVTIVAGLSACSSGSDSGNSNNDEPPTTQTPPTTDTPVVDPGNVTPPGGGEGPVTETKAGSYVGNFGGANGVYVINNQNQLAGLAINPDGSAQSLFGDVGAADTFTGSLRQYIHEQSRPDANAAVFGSVANLANPLSIAVNIVNGQTITSTAESPTAVNLVGTTGSSVSPANAQSLAGDWSAVHSFCSSDANGQPVDCLTLTTLMTFNGTEVTGSTQVTGFGVVPIVGAITEFGDAALIDFSWDGTVGYSGVVFFTPEADGRIVFIGENESAGNATISALMTRQ
ncbi:MAG: hypothetical protein AB8B87_01120 [Granulosicoccus sp.]